MSEGAVVTGGERPELEFRPQVASASSNMTVNNFVGLFKSDTLFLRPAFQRNLVWNDGQQSFLVDSILRGLPLPEIYVQTVTGPDGDESTVVVDGQQRITTCLRFVASELRLSDGTEIGSRWRGRKFSELDDDLRKRFRSFELIVRKLPELDEATLREIFRRLNQTVEALEAQELRHAAYTGPFIQLVEQAAAHPVLGEVGVFSPKDYLRRRNDEFVAEVLFAVYARAFPNKKDGLDELFRTLDAQDATGEKVQEIERRLGRVLASLEGLASALRRTRFRNKSDFYTVLVYLGRNAEWLPIDADQASSVIELLKDFSALVNNVKRAEGDEKMVAALSGEPHYADAVQYLRAVERASSDRLNRVRRDEALARLLDEFVRAGSPSPLTSSDAAWRLAPVADTEEDGEFDTVEDRVRAQTALTSGLGVPQPDRTHLELADTAEA